MAKVARALWERDGGRCGRCGHAIRLDVSAMMPDGLTIGHVVPVQAGGTDAPGNLRPEHRRCNLEAGATMPRASIVTPPRVF